MYLLSEKLQFTDQNPEKNPISVLFDSATSKNKKNVCLNKNQNTGRFDFLTSVLHLIALSLKIPISFRGIYFPRFFFIFFFIKCNTICRSEGSPTYFLLPPSYYWEER